MSVTTPRRYTSSPLPFMGQKRNFSKKFLNELTDFPEDLVFVDLFGGSGILSQLTKQSKRKSKVVYNDFDNFSLRLKSIEITNGILEFARTLLVGLDKNEKIPNKIKSEILDHIFSIQSNNGYIDYISISTQFLFSGSYVQSFDALKKGSWYNKLRKSNFDVSDYLEGVEVVCQDYRVLYDQYKSNPNVVFLIDPPYLQTQSFAYKEHWNLQQHLDTLTLLESSRFFYFTSSKSSIIELFEWLEKNNIKQSPFKCCRRLSHKQYVSGSSSYEDIMFVRR